MFIWNSSLCSRALPIAKKVWITVAIVNLKLKYFNLKWSSYKCLTYIEIRRRKGVALGLLILKLCRCCQLLVSIIFEFQATFFPLVFHIPLMFMVWFDNLPRYHLLTRNEQSPRKRVKWSIRFLLVIRVMECHIFLRFSVKG